MKARGGRAESRDVYHACLRLTEFYKRSEAAGMINEDFFDDLQEEIACELRLMEVDEIGQQLFIQDFILPKEIAKFSFFDAERMVTIAEM